jgi:predicted peroxiredoxin
VTNGRIIVGCTHDEEDPDRVAVSYLTTGAALDQGKQVVMWLTSEGVRLALGGYAEPIRAELDPPVNAADGVRRRGRHDVHVLSGLAREVTRISVQNPLRDVMLRATLQGAGSGRKESMMRKLLAAGMAAMALLGVTAGTATAKPGKHDFTYIATIDCGSGPIEVGSTDDLFAPLVDLSSGRKYQPVAWDVVVDGRTIQVSDRKKLPKHSVDCSYDDGVATGTVTVKKA